MAEGRVRVGSSFTFEYFIRDHLGNIRASFEDNGGGTARLVQENHYYAFGLRFYERRETNLFIYSLTGNSLPFC